ncbi:MAG: GGDEF domain-containing protein, partial [Firmicutes bacterium]|nr:GGDEF domain-containing protein [Bacillota bacterium]
IDTETNNFIEFSSSEEYQALDLERAGEDFFATSAENISKAVYLDDQVMVKEAFVKENLLRYLEKEGTFTMTYRLMLRDAPVYVHMKATQLYDKDHKNIVIGISNVSEQIKREIENDIELRNAKEKINRDALTGVKSKYAFDEVEAKIDELIKDKKADPFAIVVCDLNGLKLVNDTRGHIAGDNYIKDSCHVICTIFRHSPVFRIGGDEFAVILKDRDYEYRELLMEKMRKYSEECDGDMAIAVGLAGYISEQDDGIAAVFERADAAMYDNKKSLKGEKHV